eukprot:g6053.t1
MSQISLPPGLNGAVQGEIELIIGRPELTSFGKTKYSSSLNLVARINWFGDGSDEVLLPIPSFDEENPTSSAIDRCAFIYPVKCSERGLLKYLNDAVEICIEVFESSTLRAIGVAVARLDEVKSCSVSSRKLSLKNATELGREIGRLPFSLVHRFGPHSKLAMSNYLKENNAFSNNIQEGSENLEKIFSNNLQNTVELPQTIHLDSVGSLVDDLLKRGRNLKRRMDEETHRNVAVASSSLQDKRFETELSTVNNYVPQPRRKSPLSVSVKNLSDIKSFQNLPHVEQVSSPSATTISPSSTTCKNHDCNSVLTSLSDLNLGLSPRLPSNEKFDLGFSPRLPPNDMNMNTEMAVLQNISTNENSIPLLNVPLVLKEQIPKLEKEDKVITVNFKQKSGIPLSGFSESLSNELVRVYAVDVKAREIHFAVSRGTTEFLSCEQNESPQNFKLNEQNFGCKRIKGEWYVSYSIPYTKNSGEACQAESNCRLSFHETENNEEKASTKNSIRVGQLHHERVFPLLLDNAMTQKWMESSLTMILWKGRKAVGEAKVALRRVLFAPELSLQCTVPIFGSIREKLCSNLDDRDSKNSGGKKFRFSKQKKVQQKNPKKERKAKFKRQLIASLQLKIVLQKQACSVIPRESIQSINSSFSKQNTSSLALQSFQHRPTQQVMHLQVQCDWASANLASAWHPSVQSRVSLRIGYRSFANPNDLPISSIDDRSYEMWGFPSVSCEGKFKFSDVISEPLVLTSNILAYLRDHSLMLEVWAVLPFQKVHKEELKEIGKDIKDKWQFVGLCKIPLHRIHDACTVPKLQFAQKGKNTLLAREENNAALLRTLSATFPIVSTDGIVPVCDPVTGNEKGDLRVCVAAGTMAQLDLMNAMRNAALVVQRFLRFYLPSKRPKFRNARNSDKEIFPNPSNSNFVEVLEKNVVPTGNVHSRDDNKDENVSKHIYSIEIIGGCGCPPSTLSGHEADWGFFVQYQWLHADDIHLLWWDSHATLNTRTTHVIGKSVNFKFPELKFSLFPANEADQKITTELGKAVFKNSDLNLSRDSSIDVEIPIEWNMNSAFLKYFHLDKMDGSCDNSSIPSTLRLHIECKAPMNLNKSKKIEISENSTPIKTLENKKNEKSKAPITENILSTPLPKSCGKNTCTTPRSPLASTPLTDRLLPTKTSMRICVRFARSIKESLMSDNCSVAVRFAFFTGDGENQKSSRWVVQATPFSCAEWNWEEDFPVIINSAFIEYLQHCEVCFELIQRQNGEENLLGRCKVPLGETLQCREGVDGWYPYFLDDDKKLGELNLSICFSHYLRKSVESESASESKLLGITNNETVILHEDIVNKISINEEPQREEEISIIFEEEERKFMDDINLDKDQVEVRHEKEEDKKHYAEAETLFEDSSTNVQANSNREFSLSDIEGLLGLPTKHSSTSASTKLDTDKIMKEDDDTNVMTLESMFPLPPGCQYNFEKQKNEKTFVLRGKLSATLEDLDSLLGALGDKDTVDPQIQVQCVDDDDEVDDGDDDSNDDDDDDGGGEEEKRIVLTEQIILPPTSKSSAFLPIESPRKGERSATPTSFTVIAGLDNLLTNLKKSEIKTEILKTKKNENVTDVVKSKVDDEITSKSSNSKKFDPNEASFLLGSNDASFLISSKTEKSKMNLHPRRSDDSFIHEKAHDAWCNWALARVETEAASVILRWWKLQKQKEERNRKYSIFLAKKNNELAMSHLRFAWNKIASFKIPANEESFKENTLCDISNNTNNGTSNDSKKFQKFRNSNDSFSFVDDFRTARIAKILRTKIR